MMHIRKLAMAVVVVAALAATAAGQGVSLGRFAVNDYFGIPYEKEPVSFDVTLPRPAPVGAIHLSEGPWQVEILEGTPAAVRAARVWTHVDFPHVDGRPGDGAHRHKVLEVLLGDAPAGRQASDIQVRDGGRFGQVALAEVSNGRFAARVPVGTIEFDSPVSAFEVPGPVVSVSRDGREWIGTGYLDSMLRVERVTCEVQHGPIFFESRITYDFEGGRQYVSRVRVFAAKPYAQLVEDFNLGGNSRYVFNYDDWRVDGFFHPGDARLAGWQSITAGNPTGDYVQIEGQKPLARLVIWSQFNYFSGKQETIGLKSPDPAALEESYRQAVERYQEQLASYPERLARWEENERGRRPSPPTEPREPQFEPTTYTLAGAPIETWTEVTPGGAATAVGAIYNRPDRWTRAKVNHVDLYMRPEVPGDRMTRGIVGLAGAQARIAMEAWLVDGHREWAIFATRAGDDNWMAKAHVQEGVWPLDRLMRTPLVWNSDGSPVAPEDTRPGDGIVGGTAASVLRNTGGRSGLQYFNGSNPHIRQRPPSGWNRQVRETRAVAGEVNTMVDRAITCYMAADDSAYPSVRAMLPWTHPEAINPFYQGMENQNFNADLYRWIAGRAVPLLEMGHPEAGRFFDHAVTSFDMALDAYVYPQSGCWEESHTYANHTLGITSPLVQLLANSGWRDFRDDPRYARMLEFFVYVHSPHDPAFGNRVVPPVGDHGLSQNGPGRRFAEHAGLFAGSGNEEIQRILSKVAWMMQEDGGEVPEGLTPRQPDLVSRWLQGYGTVLRSRYSEDERGRPLESFLVVRAGQSWGHHHMDKGSLWGWFRNVHFFGDCSWGSPPGGTYSNPYKQGPASGTQIEFEGITNWILPCKYAAAWVSDDEYAAADGYDYVNARNMFPFNPRLDVSQSTPAALRNGYDRQVLFVHPELLIVRDNVESNTSTVWRIHSHHRDTTTVQGPQATMNTPHDVTGQMRIVYPDGVEMSTLDAFPEISPWTDRPHGDSGKPFTSLLVEWRMPRNTSATWVFGVHGPGEQAPAAERLDEDGRVTRVHLADGTEVIALMNIDPFRYSGNGIEFEGTVGLVVTRDGRTTLHPIRATTLRRTGQD